jgi:SHS2 domain-containing protein
MGEIVGLTGTRKIAARPDKLPSELFMWEHPGRMTMLFAPRPSFECLPGAGDVGIRLCAGTIGEMLQQAALAVRDILLPGRPPPGPEELHEIELDAPDRATLLITWLNELLLLAEHDCWVPSRIEIKQATDTHLRASAWGSELNHALPLDRAATCQGLRFEAREGGYEAEVLLHLRRPTMETDDARRTPGSKSERGRPCKPPCI